VESIVPRVAIHNDGGEPIIMRGRVIGRQTWPCLLYQRAAVLIECHPMAISASAAERMQQAFGLTPAEAAVSVALAEDASVAEIAHRRGVSEETVRSQSQAILRKVGVSRRAALIRVVTKLSD
jgi:DNA-binding CsgD family transcriptional regulator